VSFAGLNYKAGALDIGSSRVCVANKETEGDGAFMKPHGEEAGNFALNLLHPRGCWVSAQANRSAAG